jgi:hypothetical protein
VDLYAESPLHEFHERSGIHGGVLRARRPQRLDDLCT